MRGGARKEKRGTRECTQEETPKIEATEVVSSGMGNNTVDAS